MSNKQSSHDLKIRAVKAVLDGQTIESVSKSLKCNRSTIHRWLQQFKKSKNLDNLKPKSRSGRPKISTDKVKKSVLKDLLKPASAFGFETDFWTCRRLIQHVLKKYKIKISQPSMWRLLRDASMSYQKPEKRYKEADPIEQKRWIEEELPKIQKLARKLNAILYFEDEATIQLAPIIGKTWAPKGQTPIQKVTGNRGSIAAISAISSDGRLIFNLMRGRIKSQEIINFLDQMLKHHPRRNIVVVMDQATTHVSKMTKEFIKNQKRMHVFYLPSRSPEMNPDEKIWNHLKNQELKSHKATNLKELEKVARSKLKSMSNKPDLLKGVFMRCSIAQFMN